jgi:hypothetical protein
MSLLKFSSASHHNTATAAAVPAGGREFRQAATGIRLTS